MKTDTTKAGLETLIVTALAGTPVRTATSNATGEPIALYGGSGW